ncbi:MAG: crossover junction endodeoxyribonuclease RuvC [Syntrophales bacterium]|nr:crossover junction endodeoxyribonuclease RuvC [Syntrophales bacterium]MDY0045729.1 crossover junction endodeoxyribonuclease RuvC [Syntrophales bacterium]
MGEKKEEVIILGIDPGTRITGYGIIEKLKGELRYLSHGEIKSPNDSPLSIRLKLLFDSLMAVVNKWQPQALVIEDIFYGKNVKSLIIQGHARGAVLLIAPFNNIPVYEYSPLEIKKAVVGYGRAEKKQVQQMVKTILNLSKAAPPDASDALAAAICHAHYQKMEFL